MFLDKKELARFFVSTKKYFSLGAGKTFTKRCQFRDFIGFIEEELGWSLDDWEDEGVKALFVEKKIPDVQFPDELVKTEMWQKFMSDDEKRVLRVLCGLRNPVGLFIGRTLEISEYVGGGQKYVLYQIKQLKWRNLIMDKQTHKSFLILRLHSMFDDVKVSEA